MKQIIIDARESGTSTGRYIDKLIEYLYSLNPNYNFTIITKPHRIDFIKEIAPTFTIVETKYKEFTFGEQLGFKKQLQLLKPDLVHFGMVQQPILFKGKVVTTMHDLTTARFKNPGKNPVIFWALQQIYKWVNKKAAHKSVKVIVPSQFVKQDIVQFTRISPDKVKVTYEAADAISEKAEPIIILNNVHFIMYLGRPTPHKNIERLIEAFVKLKSDHPDLHLVLAGKIDENYRKIESTVHERTIKNVVFTDFISEGQLRWLYENCSAYVFPSLSEGFGLPGLEAMQHGAPVVSSNATCLPEIYGNAAKYFDPHSTEDMAAAVNEVLTDKTIRDQLISDGQKQVTKYSWKRMAEQTLDIYTQLLGE